MKEFIDYFNYSFPFKFMGNKGECHVKKANKSWGDGDIRTAVGKKTNVSVGADLKQLNVDKDKIVRVQITYFVWDGDYEDGTQDKDRLCFVATKDCDIPEDCVREYRKGANFYREHVTYECVEEEKNCYYRNSFFGKRHDWCQMSWENRGPNSRAVSWLDCDDISVKIDGPGNELVETGNIGVKGTIILTLKRTIKLEEVDQPTDKQEPIKIESLSQVLRAYPPTDFMDGCGYYEEIKDLPDKRGVYLRMDQEQRELKKFLCLNGDEHIYYPGNILAADECFLTDSPTVVNLKDEERCAVSMVGNAEFYTGEVDRDPFRNIVPSLANFNKAKGEFVSNYVRRCTRGNEMPMRVIYEEYLSDSSQGLSLGGTIKKVDFGLKIGVQNVKVHAFVLKQKLYTIGLNNAYFEDDSFVDSEHLNIANFVKQLHGHAPAIIDSVDYGRVVIVYVTSVDNSAFDAKIAGCQLSLGNSSKCQVKVKILGGPIEGYSFSDEFDGLDMANKIIASLYMNPVTSRDISTALPIEFTAKYLSDMSHMVTCKVLPHKLVYVDAVRVRVVDHNAGTSFGSLKFSWLDYEPDGLGKMGYVRRREEKTPDCEFFVSPKSLCLEFKVDAIGDLNTDRDILCAELPLCQLRLDKEGYWTFCLELGGKSVNHVKHNLSPFAPGYYKVYEKSMSFSKTGLYEKMEQHHYSRRQCLIEFYSWCESCRRKDWYEAISPLGYQKLEPFTKEENDMFKRDLVK